MKTKKKTNVLKDFCNIRILSGRQVLAYTQDDDEGYYMTLVFKYSGAHAEMKMTFSNEAKMEKAFANFIKGGMDELIVKQIESIETGLPVEPA
jgi:hypothetical protein